MTGTWAVMIFISGGVAALCLRSLVATLHRELRGLGNLPAWPAASKRGLARVRRHNRLDLSHVRTAREAGVRVERTSEQFEERTR